MGQDAKDEEIHIPFAMICSHGTLTRKNLLPQRQHILSCMSTIPNMLNKVWKIIPVSP